MITTREIIDAVEKVHGGVTLGGQALTVYRHRLPAGKSPNLPCVRNQFKLEGTVIQGGHRTAVWTVSSQVLVGKSMDGNDADLTAGEDALDELIRQLALNLSLEGIGSLGNFRTEDEPRTFGVDEWNGASFVVVDFAMDAVINDYIEVAP
jgi:hypothetical protein